MDGITKADMDKFENVKKLRDAVAALPKIKEMYANAGEKYAAYRA